MAEATYYAVSIDFGNKKSVIYATPITGKQEISIVSFNSQEIFPSKIVYCVPEENKWERLACDLTERGRKTLKEWVIYDLKRFATSPYEKNIKKPIFGIPEGMLQYDDKKQSQLKFKLCCTDKKIRTASIQSAISLIFSRCVEICSHELPGFDVSKTFFAITVSPSWGEIERKILLDAASLANIPSPNLVNSITAQLATLWKNCSKKIKNDECIGVIDMGDSSLDVLVARKIMNDSQNIELKVEYTDSLSIGGSDFTYKMIEYILNLIQKDKNKFNIKPADIKNNNTAMAKLHAAAEKTKEKLLLLPEVKFEGYNILPGKDIIMDVRLDDFNKDCGDLIKQIKNFIEKMVKSVDIASINTFEVSGGGSRFIPVAKVFEELIGKEKITKMLNPDECFAEGGIIWLLQKRNMIRKPVIFKDPVFYDVSIEINKKTIVRSIFNNQQGKKDSGKQKILLTNIEVPIVNDLDKGTYNFKQISAFCTNNAIIGSIEINKKGKYTLLCKINSDGIFEVRDKDGKIQYQPRKYVADKIIQNLSTVTASLKKSENEKKELEDKVYEIESLIGDIEEILNSEMPCYIEKGDQKNKFINDLKKYKEMKWFDKVTADINKEKENIKAEFKSIIDIKESYTDFDTKISSRRAEAKKLFDEYKKTTKSKNKEEDTHMKEIYNNFITGAKNVRKEFEGITDRTKSIRNSDLWNDFDKIYNEFIESFNSSQKN